MAQDHWQSLSKNCCKTRYFYLLTGQQKTKSHFKVMIKQKCRKSGISPCCHNRELLTHTEHFIVYLMQTALQSRHISTLDCNYDKSLSALDKRKLVSKIHKTIFLFFFFSDLKMIWLQGKWEQKNTEALLQNTLNCLRRRNTYLVFIACCKLLKTGK